MYVKKINRRGLVEWAGGWKPQLYIYICTLKTGEIPREYSPSRFGPGLGPDPSCD